MSMPWKSTALAAAALALVASTVTFNPAEAQWRRHHHHHRGPGIAACIIGGALIGGALLAPRAYAQPHYYSAPVYVEEPAQCYIERQRVWSERRGRYITVDREVCD